MRRQQDISPGRRTIADAVQLRLRSEYGPLRTVLVHRPGNEIDRLTPSVRESLLFEDMPYLARMIREHDDFVALMRSRGVGVLHLEPLVRDLLKDEGHRKALLERALFASAAPGLEASVLEEQSEDRLAEMLFAGLTRPEYAEMSGAAQAPSDRLEGHYLILPIPNTYFMRDTSVIFGDAIIPASLWSQARAREAKLIHSVFALHPAFASARFHLEPEGFGSRHHIEGGDVLVLNQDALFIGNSQRTYREGIMNVAKALLGNGSAKRIYEIDIPKERSFMHLDTIFTIVDRGKVVVYPFILGSGKGGEWTSHVRMTRFEADPDGGIKGFFEDRSFYQVLADEFQLPLSELVVVETGGGKIGYADREQLSDGTNTFAIGPGEVLAYERNTHTNVALREAGVTVHEVEGSELVRGLGGPRCMTMPLEREESA